MRYFITFISFILLTSCNVQKKELRLVTWNETANKKILLSYIEQVTNSGNVNFIPKKDRIAVFDNDGTLWSEYPVYFPFMAMIDYYIDVTVKKHSRNHELVDKVLKQGLSNSKKQDLYKSLVLMQEGIDNEEYEAYMKQWLETKEHPIKKSLYKDLVFQPMIELIQLLRTYDFKVYIVTGGGAQFARVLNELVYKLPPQNVIGTTFGKKVVEVDGKYVFKRLAKLENLNDKDTKVVNILERIGKVPTMVFGNSDGDFSMAKYSALNSKYKSYIGIVRHDDSIREFLYDRRSEVGKLNKILDNTEKYNINILSMKNDFKIIYKKGLKK